VSDKLLLRYSYSTAYNIINNHLRLLTVKATIQCKIIYGNKNT